MSYTFPKGMLDAKANQVVARKNKAGKWQACRVKRFAWEEPLYLIARQAGEPITAMPEDDLRDSEPVEKRGLFVILQISPKLFDSEDDIHVDDELCKDLDESDEVLVEVEKFRPPSYRVVARPEGKKGSEKAPVKTGME
jgi:hypothetical protein